MKSTKITVDTKITFNTIGPGGKVYHSVEEMPPEVRQAYEQAMASPNQSGGTQVIKLSDTEDPTITVNGQQYASVDEMPADVRQTYEMATAAMKEAEEGTQGAARTTQIIFNGRKYASVEEMPADVRQAYERAMAALKAKGIQAVTSSTTIFFRGKKYSSVEEMPPDVRRAYASLKKADELLTSQQRVRLEKMPATDRRCVERLLATEGSDSQNTVGFSSTVRAVLILLVLMGLAMLAWKFLGPMR